jgi:predicted DNA-binding transcriptional regulator YafY
MAEIGKYDRVLDLYTRLLAGEIVRKSDFAAEYGVHEKSIQRDLDDIRNFFCQKRLEEGKQESIIYDRKEKGYRLVEENSPRLTNSEILAVCKILLESRAFTKTEMNRILEKLLDCCTPRKDMETVKELISNEAFHYVEPHHHRIFLDKLWDIGQAIQHHQIIEITYTRRNNSDCVKRRLKPVAILFSEYYFYLTAFIEDSELKAHFDVADDPFPTIYRIDRIESLTVTDEHFQVPYKDRFEEGEFRKRIQFMYGGKLQKTEFWYKGDAVEAVLDRLPTAQILKEENGKYLIRAETFGKGIEMWLRSQGDVVEYNKRL